MIQNELDAHLPLLVQRLSTFGPSQSPPKKQLQWDGTVLFEA
jgi:hypothetical protein